MMKQKRRLNSRELGNKRSLALVIIMLGTLASAVAAGLFLHNVLLWQHLVYMDEHGIEREGVVTGGLTELQILPKYKLTELDEAEDEIGSSTIRIKSSYRTFVDRQHVLIEQAEHIPLRQAKLLQLYLQRDQMRELLIARGKGYGRSSVTNLLSIPIAENPEDPRDIVLELGIALNIQRKWQNALFWSRLASIGLGVVLVGLILLRRVRKLREAQDASRIAQRSGDEQDLLSQDASPA